MTWTGWRRPGRVGTDRGAARGAAGPGRRCGGAVAFRLPARGRLAAPCDEADLLSARALREGRPRGMCGGPRPTLRWSAPLRRRATAASACGRQGRSSTQPTAPPPRSQISTAPSPLRWRRRAHAPLVRGQTAASPGQARRAAREPHGRNGKARGGARPPERQGDGHVATTGRARDGGARAGTPGARRSLARNGGRPSGASMFPGVLPVERVDGCDRPSPRPSAAARTPAAS